MDMDFLKSIVQGLIAGVFTGGAVWGVLRTELKYLRRDVDHAHKRVDDHEIIYHTRAKP